MVSCVVICDRVSEDKVSPKNRTVSGKMVKRCSVDGCKSGYPADRKRKKLQGAKQIAFFSVPKNPECLEKWNNALGMHCRRKSVAASDTVCQLHFRHEDLDTQFVTVIDGKEHLIERERYRLKEGPIPIIIANADNVECNAEASVDLNALSEEAVPSNATLEGDADILMEFSVDDRVIPDHDPTDEGKDSFEDGGERNNIPRIDVETYSINLLTRDLRVHNWREGWVWSRSDDPLSIVFVQFDADKLQARVHCSIDADMEITISIGDKSFPCGIRVGILKSFEQIITVLERLETVKICVGTGLDDERRAMDCSPFPDGTDMYRQNRGFERCNACRALRHKLQKRRKPVCLAKRKSSIVKKMDLLTRRHKTLRNTVKKLKEDMTQVRKESSRRKEDVVNEAIENVPEGQQQAIRMCLASSKAKGPRGRRYTHEWVYNCLLLRIKSKRAYCHLRERNILPLPHPDTLRSYIKRMGGTYGFQKSIFQCMKTKAAEMASADTRGTLLVDEMKLGEAISLDRNTLKYTGFTYLGEHTPENQKREMGDHALIFMFQPFRGTWVQALACFLSKGCAKSDVLEKLILECVILLEEADFFVDAIVTDGASWNRGVWTLRGVNEGNVSCRHPCDVLEELHSDDLDAANDVSGRGRRLWFISDAPHLIKTMRNALMAQDETLTPDGIIKKAHWEALVKAEEATGTILRVAYLRDEHINPMYYAKMSVPLAFELFSERTQTAMKLLKDCGDPRLQDCDPTLAFTKRINNVIQALMSRCPSTALRSNDIGMESILDFQEYLEEWEQLANENWASFISKETLTGFKVSLQAIVEIFNFLQNEHNFTYLMTSRLNQDALERFNGMVRSACGSNDHPDSTMCGRVFRLLCMYSLIKPPRGSNVTGSDVLRTLVSLNDLTENNEEKEKWLDQLDAIVENACVEDGQETEELAERGTAICEDLHTYAEAYMAGYIGRKMRSTVHCSDCWTTLSSDAPKERDKMTSLMSKGELIFPSEGLFQLLKLVELTFLDVLGPNLQIRSDTLFDVLDHLKENERIPLLGCTAHSTSVTKKILNFCVLSMGHFAGHTFNQAHSERAKKTKKLRKTAKL